MYSREKIDTITNRDITTQLSHLEHFKGVFSADTIEHDVLSMKRFIIVCNLSTEYEAGSHFVTIVYWDGVLMFLDSLALNVTKYDYIMTALNELTIMEVLYLRNRVQDFNSNACGYYCIFFSYFFHYVLVTGEAPPIRMEKFSYVNRVKNDDTCISNIAKMVAVNR